MPFAESFDYFVKEVYPISDAKNPYYEALRSWLRVSDERIAVFRYEDLFGPDQLAHLSALLAHLELHVPKEVLSIIVRDKSFERYSGGRQPGASDPTSHYRRGLPGDWNNHFSEGHKQMMKQAAGQLLIDLGYEDSTR